MIGTSLKSTHVKANKIESQVGSSILLKSNIGLKCVGVNVFNPTPEDLYYNRCMATVVSGVQYIDIRVFIQRIFSGDIKAILSVYYHVNSYLSASNTPIDLLDLEFIISKLKFNIDIVIKKYFKGIVNSISDIVESAKYHSDNSELADGVNSVLKTCLMTLRGILSMIKDGTMFTISDDGIPIENNLLYSEIKELMVEYFEGEAKNTSHKILMDTMGSGDIDRLRFELIDIIL